jgi:polar amino acid transport system substrate-binding protein
MLNKVLGMAIALGLAVTITSTALAATSTLEKVKSEGVLKVCVPTVVPDLYKDSKTGEWTGVMADLLKTLTSWMKVKFQPVEVGGFDAALLTLKQGNCDLIGSSMVYNAPRAMEVNFIRPFGAKGINAVMLKTNPKNLKTPADLNSPNVTIVANLGSREQETAMRLFPKAKLLAPVLFKFRYTYMLSLPLVVQGQLSVPGTRMVREVQLSWRAQPLFVSLWQQAS